MGGLFSPESAILSFGVFELDLRSGELRKNGVRVALQDQPLRILVRLLMSPGDVVTREELRQELWPSDRFVDFEHGLNAAIKRLRDVLGDSAENPRFVATVPRRGYRFVGPVVHSDSRKKTEIRRWSWPDRRLSWAIVFAMAFLVPFVGWHAMTTRVASRSQSNGGSTRQQALVRLTYDKGVTIEPAISPDGSLVAYASDRSGDGNLDIWLQRTAGGDAIRLTRDPADDRDPTFSADGSTIAFRSDRDGGGIYFIPSHSGGDARLVVKRGRRPAFSPDGRWLAYDVSSSSHSDFSEDNAFGKAYVMPAAGGESRQLLPEFGSVEQPIWSPDSRHLLVVGRTPRPTDSRGLWVAHLDGSLPAATGAFTAFARAGLANPNAWVWLPSNEIVFSAVAGQSLDLWQLPIEPATWEIRSSPTRITEVTGSAASHASIAVDGTVAFSSSAVDDDIWSLRVDATTGQPSGDLERLTEGPFQDWEPSISTDGTMLAYMSVPAGEGAVKTKNLFTGKETVIASSSDLPWHPAISPDGSKVAYRIGRQPGNPTPEQLRKIVVSPSSNAAPELVTRNCGWCMVSQWSSGQQILFLDGGREGTAKIFALEIASGRRIPLVGDDRYDIVNANVSFDGRWMAFVVFADNRARLFESPIRTDHVVTFTEWVQLTSGESWDDKPRWSFGGDLLYFVSDRDGFRCLWAERVDATTKRPIGPPFPIYHFHRARLSMMNTPLSDLGVAVARNRIAFTLREMTGNVWIASLREPR